MTIPKKKTPPVEPLQPYEIATAVSASMAGLKHGIHGPNALVYRTLLHFRELAFQSLEALERLEKKYGVLEFPASAPRQRSPYVRKPKGGAGGRPPGLDS